MNARLYMGAPADPGYDAIYAAPDYRAQVAALPTQDGRIMAIQALHVIEQNMVCQRIIEDLLADRTVHTNYELYVTVHSIKSALYKEFLVHKDFKRGWAFMFGHKTTHTEPLALNRPEVARELKKIDINADTQELWQELADWFAGKYYKFGYKDGQLQHFQRNLFGNYPLLNSTDRLMYLFTGVRQLDISTPYYNMAQLINQRIQIVTAAKKCSAQLFSSQPVSAAPQPSAPPLQDVNDNSPYYALITPTAPALSATESSEDESREEFECPIILTQMQHAVICTLDGVSYEAEALQQSLKKHGRTPTNIEVAPENIAKVARPNTNLQAAINCFNNGEPEEEHYRCEITKESMQSAMFCTLDNRSYDGTAIREYMQTNRKTPTGVVLADNEKIEDVLVPNLTLRNVIEMHQRLTQTHENTRSFSI